MFKLASEAAGRERQEKHGHTTCSGQEVSSTSLRPDGPAQNTVDFLH